MTPKQKRTIGIILLAFSLVFMAGGAGFTIYCWKIGMRVSPAIGMMLIAVFMPLWMFGIILISRAKKEEDAK